MKLVFRFFAAAAFVFGCYATALAQATIGDGTERET
jgi:hypothetical protein